MDTEHAGKHCLVAVDAPGGPRLCTVTLASADDLEAALQRARAVLGEGAGDWQHGAVGIWGRLKARSAIPADGDRIELYRALSLDPRQRRRQRACAARDAVRPLNSPGR